MSSIRDDLKDVWRGSIPGTLSKPAWAPEEVLKHAQHNPTLNAILHYWRQGSVSWEQAMSWAVIVLCDQVERLERAEEKELLSVMQNAIIHHKQREDGK